MAEQFAENKIVLEVPMPPFDPIVSPTVRAAAHHEPAFVFGEPLSNLVSHSFAPKDINQAFELAEWQGKNSGTAATRVILGP